MTALSYTSSSEVAIYIAQLATDPSTNANDLLQLLIPRMSRRVDAATRRRFYSSTGLETKYFSIDEPSAKLFPSFDIASSSGFVLQIAYDTQAASSGTYTTIDTNDYTLMPRDRKDGWPYQWIELSDVPVGSYSTSFSYTQFPVGRNTVKTQCYIGFGTTAIAGVPDDIRHISTELVVRAWRGKDMSFSDVVGVEGLGSATFSRRLPADVAEVLEAYTRQTAG